MVYISFRRKLRCGSHYANSVMAIGDSEFEFGILDTRSISICDDR